MTKKKTRKKRLTKAKLELLKSGAQRSLDRMPKKKPPKLPKAKRVPLKRVSDRDMITRLVSRVVELEERCKELEWAVDHGKQNEIDSLRHVIRLFNHRMQRITELSGPLLDDRNSTTGNAR